MHEEINKGTKTGFPKWDGIIDLRENGLNTPNAVFLHPYSTDFAISKIVDYFIKNSKTELIALRPDGKNGIGKSPAGITFSKNERGNIISKLSSWSSEGYGVTLIETHNRFDYDFCCNILLDNSGDFLIEFVGPGFDGGDLNKSILKPTMIVSNKKEFPIFTYSDPISGHIDSEALESFFLKVSLEARNPSSEEIETRIEYITKTLLPDMGIKISRDRESTISWLKENNCQRLLERKNPREIVSAEDLKKIISSASIYANNLLRNGKSLTGKALTAHKYDDSIVFIGTYDGQKWGSVKTSNLNGHTNNQSKETQKSNQICQLCNKGEALHKNHIKLYGNEIHDSNILFETDNFYVVIDNYPVCEDHILIAPKVHVFSYSVVEQKHKNELEAIIKTLSYFVGTTKYGLFEHGSNLVGGEQKACGNSIYHAHMHFIPNLNMVKQNIISLCSEGDKSITISLKKDSQFIDYCTKKEKSERVLDFIKRLQTVKPYLFCYYSNTTGEALCLPDDTIDGGVPSQFFRRVFADHFQCGTKKPFWNWKDKEAIEESVIFRKEITKKTIEKFKDKEKLKAVLSENLKQ